MNSSTQTCHGSGLSASVIQKIHAVLDLYPQVEKAVPYGSCAKDSYKNGSDIDLIEHIQRVGTTLYARQQ